MNSESFYLIDLLLRLPRHSLFMSKARERRIWFSSSSSSLHFVLVDEVAWSVSLHCLPTAGHAVVSKTRLKVFDNKMKHIFEKCNDWSLFYSTFEKLRRKRNSKNRPSKHYERFVTLVPGGESTQRCQWRGGANEAKFCNPKKVHDAKTRPKKSPTPQNVTP